MLKFRINRKERAQTLPTPCLLSGPVLTATARRSCCPLQARLSSQHCLMRMVLSGPLLSIHPQPQKGEKCLISKTPTVGSILNLLVLDAQVKALFS